MNRRIKVLQTSALPLGYVAVIHSLDKKDATPLLVSILIFPRAETMGGSSGVLDMGRD